MGTLGLCVTTRHQMQHVVGITTCARNAGHLVSIFFTGEGVHLTQDSSFQELVKLAKVAVCEVSYLANGYHDKEIQGLSDKDFVTQARNAEMVSECDRYLVL